ncbi:TetR/AcrR family transcriptional regulator [Frankia sp. CNm7]|uniref:TetR/AcrR family transcriptional regulator n=1 Tax=Frankia nepalensis TaxID=1836974 RepID=A0A937UTW9_9ACTN|nr:TetR/AcrR family transcriptional regulator [Frankia nepalensis]MBL7500218.1 TetR/AcrR family transcriptional regulator [Frankia nepalensis]MBL7514607.1 TetR/AcrR family transcriptional regulator [Frankia nepalensis]MBL7524307.1 TetR/AcrR family transcriptional regulator [Frankia nepalensis]MBL7631680.1 TetR/AcrR family transcriptional regulator [Frankia nepalensis]
MTGTTRDRLISAAERLFAERGIDAVSLREITRASGARNAIAAQYHFNDRSGMVQAILDKHRPDVEARRNALLDQYEASDARDLRLLAGALVRPPAAKLADPDGGREYLRVYADLLNRPQPHLDLREPSLGRWRDLVGPLLEDEALTLHRRFTAMLHTAVELGRRARSTSRDDDRLFTSWLVDVVAAILAAPVSPETRRLMKDNPPKGSAEIDGASGRQEQESREPFT